MHSCCARKMIVWSLSLIFSLSYSILVCASSPAKHICRQDQRDALWEFKSEFHLSEMAANEKTQTWRSNSDCCSWDGITCDSKTGNVVELNLWGSSLEGPLRSSSGLFKLQYLQSLNLNSNNLAGILPDSIGNLKHLRDLSLSGCNLFGNLPSSLGNLSDLTHLDLDGNGFTGELPDSMGNLKQLKKLLLASSKLSGNFRHALLNLTELTAINLVSNLLEGTLPSNMSSLSKLEYFNIGSNSFSGLVPSSLFMIPSLTLLNLERNHFKGLLGIGNISSPSKLKILSLGGNKLSGPIPGFISKLVELSSLDLSYWDTLRGTVDFSMFLHLKSLASLDISTLNTRSIVDMSLFSDFESLNLLSLSRNTVKFSSTLHHLATPIGSLALASCNISEFPKFLQTQTSLFYLDIAENQIKGRVPEWLWGLPGLEYVDFSLNLLSGFDGPPGVFQRNEIYLLDISYNAFKDPFPLLPKSLTFLAASDNQFSGEIPETICELDSLETIVLSNNNFSGSIPRCLEKFNTKLTVLHLQNNNLSGEFPEESVSVGLVSLEVGHNQLSGELPKSLINCTGLEFLNVEENKFKDTFPFWLRLLPDLQFLVLRSNEFHGPIYYSPPEVASLNFPKLRIFDVSKNLFTGALPSDYFAAGWSEMSSGVYTPDNKQQRFIGISFLNYLKSVVLANKGLEMKLLGEEDTIKQDKEDEEEDQVLSWTAPAIAYVPGVFCGFVIAHILTSYRHDWFKKIFNCIA
ncbi:hypothetical protein Bca52824_090104 [Brassica carinata]|uniref:Leucine-rich repeat-containing N-terminal plant-type domain-containing protein n=1 Tax=Brassica carinata TaxID=52824 RepID=A0A8X7NWN2_BRACI|nr:hypothetical protein Bca52824_090104 [Brassica carinata]